MNVSDYLAIEDPHRREQAIGDAEEILNNAQEGVAKLKAAEAGLRLLEHFRGEDGELPEGDDRPAWIEFEFDPDADPVSGAGSTVHRVYNSKDEVIWDRGADELELEIDSDVTDFLTGAAEADPLFFEKNEAELLIYELPL